MDLSLNQKLKIVNCFFTTPLVQIKLINIFIVSILIPDAPSNYIKSQNHLCLDQQAKIRLALQLNLDGLK